MAKGRTTPKYDIKGEATGFAQKTWKHGLILAIFVGGTLMALSGLLSGIGGEYGANEGTNVIHMSIVRKADTIDAKLSMGHGPLLVATDEPTVSVGDQVHWTFSTPQRLVASGRKRREVIFTGTIEDGEIKGVLQDGMTVMPIKLPRDGIASIYRMFQSHLPWAS
ncbi:MAG TPA: hypothetical protein V6C81_01380 [Planktothrix sp.]|jgi:hypothetical protein